MAMLRAGTIRFLLLAILTLLVCAPAAAACALDSGANLSNRVVTSADLANYSSLECVNFQHADLRGVSFLQADLKYADFRFANVTGDDFSQATLYDSDFYGAQAARADFGQAMMQYTNLHHANLQGADFIQTYLEHAALGAANTSGANFTQADTYAATGVPSGSSAAGVLVILLIAVGLLIAVPILIRIIWKKSRPSRASANTSSRSSATPASLLSSAPQSPGAGAVDSSAVDPLAEVEKLDQMHKRGELSDNEFDAAKKRVLGET
jgi:hypothetical protein